MRREARDREQGAPGAARTPPAPALHIAPGPGKTPTGRRATAQARRLPLQAPSAAAAPTRRLGQLLALGAPLQRRAPSPQAEHHGLTPGPVFKGFCLRRRRLHLPRSRALWDSTLAASLLLLPPR